MDGTTRHRVFYDDACAFCVRQVRRLARLDWTGQFRWVPRSSPEAAELAVGLNPGALDQAIHCVGRDGVVCRGARCLRFIAVRLPLLAPLALLLWLPGVLPVAEAGYRWISRRRHRLGGDPALPCGCRPGREH
jgi:predicted DCC family thiol-disulfide oxidoreductase YuxK